jgi:hypothetical protein
LHDPIIADSSHTAPAQPSGHVGAASGGSGTSNALSRNEIIV